MVHGNLEHCNILVFLVYYRGQPGSGVYSDYNTALEEDPKYLVILNALLILRVP